MPRQGLIFPAVCRSGGELAGLFFCLSSGRRPMADRVALFIDAQNVLQAARRCFHDDAATHHTHGQTDPLALGNLICERLPPGLTRTLSEVRIYTGRPDSSKQPKTYGAHMRHCEAWERAGAIVIPRALRYPGDWPATRAEQKGVDVELAIDFIAGAIDGRYDVGVIFSTDTDLRPALEFVTDRFQQYPGRRQRRGEGLTPIVRCACEGPGRHGCTTSTMTTIRLSATARTICRPNGRAPACGLRQPIDHGLTHCRVAVVP